MACSHAAIHTLSDLGIMSSEFITKHGEANNEVAQNSSSVGQREQSGLSAGSKPLMGLPIVEANMLAQALRAK
jgi:hypothetical protein